MSIFFGNLPGYHSTIPVKDDLCVVINTALRGTLVCSVQDIVEGILGFGFWAARTCFRYVHYKVQLVYLGGAAQDFQCLSGRHVTYF